jgi:hypothetical protein
LFLLKKQVVDILVERVIISKDREINDEIRLDLCLVDIMAHKARASIGSFNLRRSPSCCRVTDPTDHERHNQFHETAQFRLIYDG